MEHLDRAITYVGGVGILAGHLGLVQAAVSNWRARGNVPAEHCPAIERVTRGAVTCEQLRPDVEWSVLRKRRRAA
jgi:DNA-binding transcriptional regulator YdaS (Cro superfamily)